MAQSIFISKNFETLFNTNPNYVFYAGQDDKGRSYLEITQVSIKIFLKSILHMCFFNYFSTPEEATFWQNIKYTFNIGNFSCQKIIKAAKEDLIRLSKGTFNEEVVIKNIDHFSTQISTNFSHFYKKSTQSQLSSASSSAEAAKTNFSKRSSPSPQISQLPTTSHISSSYSPSISPSPVKEEKLVFNTLEKVINFAKHGTAKDLQQKPLSSTEIRTDWKIPDEPGDLNLIYFLIRYGNIEVLQELVNQGHALIIAEEGGTTEIPPIAVAIKFDQLEVLKWFNEQTNQNIESKDLPEVKCLKDLLKEKDCGFESHEAIAKQYGCREILHWMKENELLESKVPNPFLEHLTQNNLSSLQSKDTKLTTDMVQDIAIYGEVSSLEWLINSGNIKSTTFSITEHITKHIYETEALNLEVSLIYFLIKYGRLDMLQSLVQQEGHGDFIAQEDCNGYFNAAHLAAKYDQKEILMWLNRQEKPLKKIISDGNGLCIITCLKDLITEKPFIINDYDYKTIQSIARQHSHEDLANWLESIIR